MSTERKSAPAVDLDALPFDQYQRYRLVADLLGEVRGDAPLRVLDVGGRTALLRAFLPEDRVELVDVEPSDAPGLVLGTGAALPFQDGAFDAVCAFDTLEHVPPAYRDAFVAECARVAGRWVILAGPYAHPRVDAAEERLVDFLQHKLGLQHRYLSEHRENGLPVRAATGAALEAAGAVVGSYGHGELARWLALMCVELYLDHDPMLRPVAPRFFRFYNRALYESDHGEEVYRHAVVGAFNGAVLPEAARLASPPAPPHGATEVLTSLAAELMAFDRERDALTPEFERLNGVIEGLVEDLEGHRSRLADRTADLEAHEETLTQLRSTYDETLSEHASERETLEADLAEHARSLDVQAQELAEALATQERTAEEAAAQRAELEEELAEHARTLAAAQEEHERTMSEATAQREELEGDLKEHALVLSETQANLERTIQEAEAQRQELEQHLSEHVRVLAETQAGAEAIQQELLAARADIQGLVEVLDGRARDIAELRGMLRDRVGNLKRAFGKKLTFEDEGA